MAATVATLAGCLAAVTALGLAGAGLFGAAAAASTGPESGFASDYPAVFRAPVGSVEHASDASVASPLVTQTAQPARQAEPEAGEAESAPAQPGGNMTPEELSTGPVLEWTEIDPGFADLFNFESVDDGRVLARAWGIGDELAMDGERAVYTDNGIDWTELPLPEGIVIRGIDISGDRWLAYGYTHGDHEHGDLVDRVFFTDDRSATWTELNLDIPPDSIAAPSHCDRFLFVRSASVSDDGIVVDVWGYRVSDTPSDLCPDVASMRLLWSDGSTVKLGDLPEESIDDMLAFEAHVVDNGFAVSAVDDVLSVQRIENGEPASTAATFEGLFPTGTLAAGSAGVAVTAFVSLGGQMEASTIGGLPVWRDPDRISEPTDVPLWLGWSADGTEWGWQSLPDAFGITEGEPWAQLAVGSDFVIARVETVIAPTPEEFAAARPEDPCAPDASLDTDEISYADAPPLRWFIARVS